VCAGRLRARDRPPADAACGGGSTTSRFQRTRSSPCPPDRGRPRSSFECIPTARQQHSQTCFLAQTRSRSALNELGGPARRSRRGEVEGRVCGNPPGRKLASVSPLLGQGVRRLLGPLADRWLRKGRYLCVSVGLTRTCDDQWLTPLRALRSRSSLVLSRRERFRTGTTAKPASGKLAATSHGAHAFGVSGASGGQLSAALPALHLPGLPDRLTGSRAGTTSLPPGHRVRRRVGRSSDVTVCRGWRWSACSSQSSSVLGDRSEVWMGTRVGSRHITPEPLARGFAVAAGCIGAGPGGGLRS
jgi:hypothetical protein